ncbi:BZ3500_MvSof-1268-A1-R1_Chr2-1g04673 [Microbotryum saponariae]|uniref:BZ3500_MvSof-1268-A1-R1_Chr2-1g04673 protein n=1 Tax=Microbotryum saponariae TaxID=289078 RepID=A0A2X0MCE3_9BASI|nr:BZ3500_MvSof-1268-A1-R1_Chr2-1g04673 [Microbotryum saponariae]SCZ92285.1 BZ3501_MvSof-1269-A2-R1_Chr2-1g04329 [Microbotryum saponariae]
MVALTAAESALLHLNEPQASTSGLVQDACAAEALKVLHSPFARACWQIDSGALSSSATPRFGIDLASLPTRDEPNFELNLLSVGVAALHAFVQINWTGPTLELDPRDLFDSKDGASTFAPEQINDTAIEELAYSGEPAYHLTKHAILLVLALQIFGLLRSPYDTADSEENLPSTSSTLVSTIPTSLRWSLESVKIWRLRAGLVWLKILDEPVPLPLSIASEASTLRLALPHDSPDRASLSLSLSLLSTLLSRSSPHSTAQKEASALAVQAAQEIGLEWELTGRMGKRTKWQVDEKTQLVVLARDRTSQQAKDEETSKQVETAAAPTPVPEAFALNDDTLLERTAFTQDSSAPKPVDEDPDSLSSMDPTSQPDISPFSQSVLLALSLATLPAPTSLMNLSADVLSTSQVSSFVSRVVLQPQNWSVHSMALLLRCRAEAGRSRTVERGVLQMQALVDQLKDGSPRDISAISSAVKSEDMAPARDRLAHFHALNLPPWWEMERELATRYGSLGITKSALEIFTRLEMWEEVARCWTSLERADRGIAIIRELLEGKKVETELVMEARKTDGASRILRGGPRREAKMWCILGELEKDSQHFEKAWIVSGKTSSLAQRSLGATYWAANDYEKARDALRLALAINPLFPRSWFVLGCAEMRLLNWAGAQEAFGRCVALEDDDAESWSNLASCHLRRGETEGDDDSEETWDALDDDDDDQISTTTPMTAPTASTAKQTESEEVVKLPFSRKRAAFHCLKQAIKHSYDSWRMWYNYMIVAVDVGELSEACRALTRITEMRIAKDGEGAIDLEVLERLVDAVTRQLDDEPDQAQSSTPYVNPNSGKGLLPRVERLIDTTILPHCSSSARVFLARARLYLFQSDYAGALDCHLKAYRAVVGSDESITHDKKAFLAATTRVEEVVTMLENLGPKSKADGELVAKDWKFQARSIVRTFMGRTRDSFGDEKAFEKVKDLLQDLKG